jgi:transcriptional regulator with XRE-family HTH domain
LKAKRLSIRPQDFGISVDKHRAPGLTQLELSRLVTVDDRTIQHIEAFTRIPSPETLAAIATGLRLSEVEHAHLDRLVVQCRFVM